MRAIDADALMEKYGEPCHSFADVIEDMPTLDLAPKWISVEDRLPPDKGKSILVANGHGYVRILAFWNKDDAGWKWIDQNGHFKHFNDITHWMPLPEPPKEEE